MLFRIFSSNDFCFDQDFYESCCSPFTLLLLVYLITSCTVLGYKEIFYHHPRFPYSRFSSHLPFLPLPLSLPYDLYDYIAHFFPLFRTYFFILYLYHYRYRYHYLYASHSPDLSRRPFPPLFPSLSFLILFFLPLLFSLPTFHSLFPSLPTFFYLSFSLLLGRHRRPF